MARVCLFIINGLGMGNSIRCHAVMEHLWEADAEIHVLTSGNGHWYFSDKREIASLTPMDAFFYSRGKTGISVGRTLLSLVALRRIARRKEAALEKLLATVHPDVAVIDSEYGVAPLRRRRIPIIGLNNSDVVVSEYLRGAQGLEHVRGHFWGVEFPDYLFHKQRCDLVISPAADRVPPRHPRIRRVGLILRRQVVDMLPETREQEFPLPRECRSFVFMLSGSVFASSIPFARASLPFRVDVVGREGDDMPGVTFHGRLMDNTELLRKSDALVVNAGFCAVSEAIALRKPTFVIPVPGHAEQAVNAAVLCRLGCGFVATEHDVLDMIMERVAKNQWTGLQAGRPITGVDGAEEAARLIAGFPGPASAAPQPGARSS